MATGLIDAISTGDGSANGKNCRSSVPVFTDALAANIHAGLQGVVL